MLLVKKIKHSFLYSIRINLAHNCYRGKTMVHEWAKLRWGVYEEHGYPGDPLFPIFYWRTSYTAGGSRREVGLNFCINSPIVGYEQVSYNFC